MTSMAPKYIVPVILAGSIFLGSGILMVLLASILKSFHALWTVLFNVMALMIPQLCNGCDFSEFGSDYDASFGDSGGGYSTDDPHNVVASRTRIWVFILVSLMFVCQGSAIWIVVAQYSKAPDQWPAIALITNCFLQSISGILFFAAR